MQSLLERQIEEHLGAAASSLPENLQALLGAVAQEYEKNAQMGQDLSALRNIETELQRSRAMLAEAQRIAQIGSWEWTLGDNCLHWSDEMHRIFGVSRGDFVPSFENFMALVHPADRAGLIAGIEKTIKGGQRFSMQHRLCRADGSLRLVECTGNLASDAAGVPQRFSGTSQDITDRAKLQEQLLFADRLSTIGSGDGCSIRRL